ncbi:hypothetical protein ACFL0M_08770, partial [Thermodesulfobacteriota bacterium]
LKKFYYYQDVTSLSSLIDPFKDHPDIQEYRSPYQHIHFVNAPDIYKHRMIYAQYSDKFTKEPDFPQDMWLFLNSKDQFTSNVEEFYHEFFTHVLSSGSNHQRKYWSLEVAMGLYYGSC